MLGIGACSKALERLEIEHEIVDAVEIDKYAIESFNAIHNTNFEVQDITKWDKNIEVDLIMQGSPCQDFSVAGLGKGGDEGTGTRSSLLYETIRIVEKLKPKYVIWENVKNLISKKHRHNFDNYINRLEELGYKSYYQVLNSKDYGIPQNRERIFTISIRKDIDNGYIFPEKQELKLRLKDMLENNVDEKYYLNDVQINRITTTTYNVGKTRIQEKDYCDTLQAAMGNGGGNVPIIKVKNNTKKGYLEATNGDGVYTNPTTKRGTVQKGMIQTITTRQELGVITNNLRIRKLTSKECWRLQGFDDEDFYKAKERLNNTFYKGKDKSNSQLYKQAGNSITVNVLEKILERLLK